MNVKEVFFSELDQHLATMKSLAALVDPVVTAANVLSAALLNGSKVLTCGNGGSAADASHIATEFIVRFQDDRRPYPAIALTEHGGAMTAICNDYGQDFIFERQVRGYGRAGDVLIILSTSGNSKNVKLALDAACDLNMKSIAFLGKGGGICKGIATVDLLVPADVTRRVQEAHLLLYHSICHIVDQNLIAAEKH